MTKQIILFLVLIFGTGCAAETTRSQQQQPTPEPNAVASTPDPAASPELSAEQSLRLEKAIPEKSRQILEQAEKIELFEIESCLEGISPKLGRIEPNEFQGCRITKKAIVRDANLKRRILDGLFSGVGSSPGGMACFSPHHGVRAIHKNERVDLVICFECWNFRGASSAGDVGGSISNAPRELFEQVLANRKK